MTQNVKDTDSKDASALSDSELETINGGQSGPATAATAEAGVVAAAGTAGAAVGAADDDVAFTAQPLWHET